MTDIVIYHCKLRIVRRDGWAWGPEPQRLLQSAVHTLPALLARQLEEVWEDERDYETAAPVRLTIPVRLSECLAVDVAHIDGDATPEVAFRPALQARLAHALRLTLLRDHCIPAETAHAKQPQSQTSQVGETDVTPELWWGGTLLRLLLSWWEQGVLATRLEFCALPSLEAWYRSLCTTRSPALAGSTAVLPEVLDQRLQTLATTLPAPAPHRAAMLRRWLVLAIDIAHDLGVLPGDAIVQQALQQILPLSLPKVNDTAAASTPLMHAHRWRHTDDMEQSLPAAPEHAVHILAPQRVPPPSLSSPAVFHREARSAWNTDDTAPAPPAAPDQAVESPTPQRIPSPPPSSLAVLYEGEASIASALPFLLLGPLTRLGYVQTLTAVLEAVDLLPQMRLFATALAYKVLEPPQPGWRRQPTAASAAASFAALAAPVPEPALSAFAQHVSAHLSPLDAVLTDTLMTGHNPQQPLLLYRTEPAHGLLLVDVEGLFPMAWAEELETLLPVLTRCQASLLLVPQATADSQLLGQLHGANFRFVTDAPPTRHEYWRPVRHPALGRWWTNDAITAESQIVQAAQFLADATEETAVLWRELAIARPAVAGSHATALDHSLTLTAAVALGTIAWTLWRDREPAVPHLTLARFRDFEARVRFSRDTVRVQLPLGRRYLDLHAHGLLDDVHNVPWFDGRVLQFAGG